jgi:hypothetical protein
MRESSARLGASPRVWRPNIDRFNYSVSYVTFGTRIQILMGHLQHIAMVTDTFKNDGRIMTYESEYYSLKY